MPLSGMKSCVCLSAAEVWVVAIRLGSFGSASRREALGDERVRGVQGGRVLGAGPVEDRAQRAGYGLDVADHALAVVTVELGGDVDQPTGVGDEVRRPEDAAVVQQPRDAVVGELVVGGAGDDRDLQELDT